MYESTPFLYNHLVRLKILGDPQFKLQGIQCISHEHGNGHGAYPARDRCDKSRDLLSFLKIHITFEDRDLLTCLFTDLFADPVDTHINNTGARFDPFGFDKSWNAGSDDQNVRSLTDTGTTRAFEQVVPVNSR